MTMDLLLQDFDVIAEIPCSLLAVLELGFERGLALGLLEPGPPQVLDDVADTEVEVPGDLNTLDTRRVSPVMRRIDCVFHISFFCLARRI